MVQLVDNEIRFYTENFKGLSKIDGFDIANIFPHKDKIEIEFKTVPSGNLESWNKLNILLKMYTILEVGYGFNYKIDISKNIIILYFDVSKYKLVIY